MVTTPLPTAEKLYRTLARVRAEVTEDGVGQSAPPDHRGIVAEFDAELTVPSPWQRKDEVWNAVGVDRRPIGIAQAGRPLPGRVAPPRPRRQTVGIELERTVAV